MPARDSIILGSINLYFEDGSITAKLPRGGEHYTHEMSLGELEALLSIVKDHLKEKKKHHG